MTTVQKVIIAFLSVVALALFGLVVFLYSGAWQRPLGPALRIATVTPLGMPATWTPDPNATRPVLSAVVPATVVNASPAPTANPVAAAVGLCGAPAVMNILAIGTDARADSYNYGLADVIRLVRVDFVNPKVTVLEFPRDLWVEIPDIADNINGQD